MLWPGEVDGTVTNALIKKPSTWRAIIIQGHTEAYADMTGTKKCYHDAGP